MGKKLLVKSTEWHPLCPCLCRNGTEQDINNLWEFGGTWLQVCPGENIFAYSAESGEDALEIILKSTPAFWGV